MVAEAVQEAVVQALCFASNAEPDWGAVYEWLCVVADHTEPNGATLYGACFAWATAVKHIENLDRVSMELEPMPGASPSQDDTDRASAVASYIAAVINADNRGALQVWGALAPEKAVRLTWDVLCVAGACGRRRLAGQQ